MKRAILLFLASLFFISGCNNDNEPVIIDFTSYHTGYNSKVPDFLLAMEDFEVELIEDNLDYLAHEFSYFYDLTYNWNFIWDSPYTDKELSHHISFHMASQILDSYSYALQLGGFRYHLVNSDEIVGVGTLSTLIHADIVNERYIIFTDDYDTSVFIKVGMDYIADFVDFEDYTADFEKYTGYRIVINSSIEVSILYAIPTEDNDV